MLHLRYIKMPPVLTSQHNSLVPNSHPIQHLIIVQLPSLQLVLLQLLQINPLNHLLLSNTDLHQHSLQINIGIYILHSLLLSPLQLVYHQLRITELILYTQHLQNSCVLVHQEYLIRPVTNKQVRIVMSQTPTLISPLQRSQPLEIIRLVRVPISKNHLLPPSQKVNDLISRKQHRSLQKIFGRKCFRLKHKTRTRIARL